MAGLGDKKQGETEQSADPGMKPWEGPRPPTQTVSSGRDGMRYSKGEGKMAKEGIREIWPMTIRGLQRHSRSLGCWGGAGMESEKRVMRVSRRLGSEGQ